MSQYTVICHRCGKSTFVDLSRTISDQRCRACRGFLQGVDVSIGDKHLESRRKLVIKVAGSHGREPEWHDQDTPVIPIRQRWPRFYRWVMWGGLLGFLIAIGIAAMRKFRTTLGGHRDGIVQEAPAPVDVRLTEEWRVKATALAEKALAITEIDELLPLFYHPEVSDDVIRRYYATEEKLPLGTDLVKDYIFFPHDRSEENAVAFTFIDSALRQRAFVIVEKPKGMVIDWPSLTGLGEMPLKQYLRTMPPGVVVLRARARIGHYYNHYFADSSKWLSIRLSDVTDENVFHGYMDRSLTITGGVESSFPNPETGRIIPDKPVIVVLKHPPGNVQSDQTQIISLLATSWYYSGGLQPLIEQARKEDAVRTGIPATEEKVETPAPPDKPPGESPPPAPEPVPPAPGSQP